MKITFFGHSDFYAGNKYDKYKEKALALLESIAADSDVEFLLGEYGGFDSFAYTVAAEFAKSHPKARLTHVLAYIKPKEDYSPFRRFDSTVYPEIETVPKRFAIIHRNRWMANEADAVIAYVAHGWGGAYQAYKYALGRGKRVFNLYEE